MYKLSLICECVFHVIFLKRKSEDNFGNSSGGDKRTRKSEIKISKREQIFKSIKGKSTSYSRKFINFANENS